MVLISVEFDHMLHSLSRHVDLNDVTRTCPGTEVNDVVDEI